MFGMFFGHNVDLNIEMSFNRKTC